MTLDQSGNDIKRLYQEVIVDHSKKPRNFKKLEAFSSSMEGFNPLCGDRLTLYLNIVSDRVEDASFLGQGCAISTASASMMTEKIKGKTKDEAKKIFEAFHKLLTHGRLENEGEAELLGKLAVFEGVHEFPSRVKCASLSWHTLKSALDGDSKNQEPVKTE